MTKKKARLAILFSGRGSNMQSLAAHIKKPHIPAEIALTISNRPDAKAIGWARANKLPCTIIDHTKYKTRAKFETELHTALKSAHIDIICAAGFMRLLTADFVNRWHNRLLNIHPSLLPKYKGLNTHARVFENGDTEHGCTVHFIRAAMDDGPIVVQRKIPVLKEDTPETLACRVLEQEHIAYRQALDIVLKDFFGPREIFS